MLTKRDIQELRGTVKNLNTDDEIEEIEEVLDRFDKEVDDRFDREVNPDENGMVHDVKRIVINPRDSGERVVEFPDEDTSDIVINDHDELEIKHKVSIQSGLKTLNTGESGGFLGGFL